MSSFYSSYTLPTIDFVGGETQELVFHIYFHKSRSPFSLENCVSDFSIVSFRNKTGAPILTKEMKVTFDQKELVDNILTVTLDPHDTFDLSGKYIYQIQIRDIDGIVEIPKQGILYITNNINKKFIE